MISDILRQEGRLGKPSWNSHHPTAPLTLPSSWQCLPAAVTCTPIRSFLVSFFPIWSFLGCSRFFVASLHLSFSQEFNFPLCLSYSVAPWLILETVGVISRQSPSLSYLHCIRTVQGPTFPCNNKSLQVVLYIFFLCSETIVLILNHRPYIIQVPWLRSTCLFKGILKNFFEGLCKWLW